MRKVLVLVLLAVLLVVADRAAVGYAERSVAQELQRASMLAAEPTVRIDGFPFLTQVVRGRYERVEVSAQDVPGGELRLAELDSVLTGASVSLSQVLSGQVGEVPVERVEARVRVAYDALSRGTGSRRLTVAPAGGGMVRVRGSVEVLGQTLSAVAISRVTLSGSALVVTATSFEVGNDVANAVLTQALGDRLDFRVPIDGLPYGLVVDGLSVEPDGVVVTARAVDTVLTPR